MNKEAMKLALEVMQNQGDVSVDEWIAAEKALQEALAKQPAQQERCHLCDCTGDIHSADGEWRGECPYCKQPAQQEPVAWMYDWICDGKLLEGWIAHKESEIPRSLASNIRPLYTSPPAQQEPVAWREFDGEGDYFYRDYYMNEQYAQEWDQRNPNHKGWVEPLYLAPPAQRTWVGLTDEERMEIYNKPLTKASCMGAVEAKLKEKNT